MTDWLEKARAGCGFCAEVNDLGKRELCPDRAEHQRTATKMAEAVQAAERPLLERIYALEEDMNPHDVCRVDAALRKRGPADAD